MRMIQTPAGPFGWCLGDYTITSRTVWLVFGDYTITRRTVWLVFGDYPITSRTV